MVTQGNKKERKELRYFLKAQTIKAQYMADEELKAQLDRIEQNSLLAAKNVLTIDDVALLTGLSKAYLYRLTSTNQIPFYKRGGKLNYFKRSEIEAWMLQNRVLTQQEAASAAARHDLQKEQKGKKHGTK